MPDNNHFDENYSRFLASNSSPPDPRYPGTQQCGIVSDTDSTELVGEASSNTTFSDITEGSDPFFTPQSRVKQNRSMPPKEYLLRGPSPHNKNQDRPPSNYQTQDMLVGPCGFKSGPSVRRYDYENDLHGGYNRVYDERVICKEMDAKPPRPDYYDRLYDERSAQKSHKMSDHHAKYPIHGNLKPTPPRSSPSTIMIEISPGLRVRLRGADETWRAIQMDFYVPSMCYICDITIFCIQDAGYVMCPVCRVIRPVEDIIDKQAGGIGLGFKHEDLIEWQKEIAQDIRIRNKKYNR